MAVRGLRWFVVAGLVALSIGRAAAAVSDGTLVVRGVLRPAGHQSGKIRLTVAPPPATRTRVTATLTVGSTAVPLAVVIGRNGRVSTRSVALPTADFGVVRLDLPAPIGESIEFAAADCVARPHGRILDCPASAAASGSAPDGVYDTAVERTDNGQHSPIAPALTSVTTGSNGSRTLNVHLSIYDGLWLTGPTDGSTAALSGYSITGGDIVASASGSATSSHGATESRFDGTATSSPFGGASTWSFVLTRPATGTPAELGGAWIVTFDSSYGAFDGDMTLDLTVPADGHATTAPTALTSGGATIYTVDAGQCLVAPAGALSCWLPTPQVDGVTLHGALDLASGNGSGRFYVGSPPSITADGTWTAVRP